MLGLKKIETAEDRGKWKKLSTPWRCEPCYGDRAEWTNNKKEPTQRKRPPLSCLKGSSSDKSFFLGMRRIKCSSPNQNSPFLYFAGKFFVFFLSPGLRFHHQIGLKWTFGALYSGLNLSDWLLRSGHRIAGIRYMPRHTKMCSWTVAFELFLQRIAGKGRVHFI